MKALKMTAAAFCAAAVFVACEKQNNGNENGGGNGTPDPVDTPDGITIPEIINQSYYYGDYYENGKGNYVINLVKGAIEYDEDSDTYYGDGSVLSLEILGKLAEDADHALIPEGTYTIADGNWLTADDSDVLSYYIECETGKETVQHTFTEGSIVIEKSAKGVKINVTAKTASGEDFAYSYEGNGYLVNNTDDTLFSNLDKDIKVGSLVKASYCDFGDLVEDGTTRTWVLSIGDKHYDLDTDYGDGESILLYVNIPFSQENLETAKFEAWSDLMEEEWSANSLVAGFSYYGMVMGCYYICPATGYTAALADGYVDLKIDGKHFTVSGELKDRYGKTVTFTYDGEPELYVMPDAASPAGVRANVRRK